MTTTASPVLPRWYPQLQTVAAITGLHASRSPDTPAVECEGRVTTYARLHRDSNRTATALIRAGLGRGSRVAYLGRESELYYELLFACAKAGAVLVPVNWRLTLPEVEHILRDAGVEAVFVEPEQVSALPTAGELPRLREVIRIEPGAPGRGEWDAWTAGTDDADLPEVSGPDDPVAQLYTSGTTGLPKGVVLPNRSFFAIRDGLASEGLDWIDWRDGDRSLIGIPGFHVGGLWWSLQGFAAGVTNVSLRMFTSTTALDLIRGGVSTACVVPAMLQMILAEPGLTGDDFATLRKVVYGGSPISPSLLTRGIEVMGCAFAQIYGLTETGNTAICLPPAEHVPGSPRLGAAGRPYPGVSVLVVGEDGEPLPAREVGEVRLRTPAAMLEYWGLPEATASTLVDGWIHTGDAGWLDEDGFLYVCDRIKDTVIVAGENVYPAEVEKALCAHPSVVDAAVVGIPHERWGEAVHAFVVLADGERVTPRALSLSLRGRIADFKIPTSYDVIDRVPRNPSGKVLRRELRAPYWAGRTRNVN